MACLFFTVAQHANAGENLLRYPQALFSFGPEAVDPLEETDTISIINGEGQIYSFEVEIAREKTDQQKGLMYRKTMAEDHGMLFVFDNIRPRTFWMKNTYIPLDILYLYEDGRIHHIAQNTTPESKKLVPSNGPVKNVLELNAGITKKYGIKAGDIVINPEYFINGVAE